MDLVLFYIKESSVLLMSFLILIFTLGLICYLTIRKFRQDSKCKVIFYGLFFELRNIDLIKLSIITIRTFLIFYCSVIHTDNIYIYIIMIAIVSFLYVVLSKKRFLNEFICSIIQIITVYFTYVLDNYITEMEYTVLLLIVNIALKSFTIIFSIYFFLKNTYDIVDNSNKVKLKNVGKVIKNEE